MAGNKNDGSNTDLQTDGTADQPTQDSHTTDDWKVLGKTDVATGVGVLGHNTAGSGVSTGVKGVVDSSDRDAAALHGVTTSGESDALVADSTGANGNAIRAKADSNTGFGYGMWVSNYASSGNSAVGIWTETSSPDAAALVADNNAGGQAISANGWVGIDDLGVEAHQTSDISNTGSYTKVIYDNEIVDDRNEYDPSTGKFTCANDGTYQVEAQIEWGSMPDGTGLFVEIRVNNNTEIKNYQEVGTSNTTGPTQAISKTIRGLTSGDVITIHAKHNDGSTSHKIFGFSNYAQLQITQLG